MRRVIRHRPSPAMVLAMIALIVALGGSAFAALRGVPDKKGVFHGCVNNSSGELRVVKRAASCRGVKKRNGKIVFPGETAIAWNQKGRPGTNGTNGIDGTDGTNGTNGINGTHGTNGTDGTDGADGAPAASYLGGRSTYFDVGTSSYSAPIGTSTVSDTASHVDMVSPAQTIVARDLFVRRDLVNFSGPPTFALAVNGVDSALQCTMSPEDTATTCSDTTHAVVIPAGSTIAIHQTDSGAGGTNTQNPYRFGWRATTP